MENDYGTMGDSNYQVIGNIAVFSLVFQNSKKAIAAGEIFLTLPIAIAVNNTPFPGYDSTNNTVYHFLLTNTGGISPTANIPINHSLRISAAFIKR